MSINRKLGDLANVLDDGTEGQVLSFNASGAIAASDIAAGASVYDSAALLPLSGLSAGDMAYVTGTNRFYISNGTGWYSVSLINTNPSITSVQDSAGGTTPFTLTTDGTATVITVTASDPEEVPLTYNYSVTSGSLTNGGGTTATVTQADNVFTVTPSTTEAYAGTFELTFTASDGINQGTSANSFTLQFITIVANSRYTTLLTTATGTSDNNNITDASTNNHSITVNGDTHAGTFSPYRSGGYSVHLDDGEEISFPDSSNYNLSNGSFSIEAWVYPTSYDSPWSGVISQFSSSSRGWGLAFSSTQITFLGSTNGGSSTNVNGSVTSSVPLNQWTHLLVTRDSNTIRIFNNGVLVNNFTESGTFNNSTNPLRIGELNSDASENFRGYVKDARVVKGSVPTEYQTSSTTNSTTIFSVPSEPLTAVTDTVLLSCHLPYISDGSTNNATPTLSGNVSTKPLSPYDYSEYSATDHGGSVYFDGSGDNLTVSSFYDFAGNGYSISFWFRLDNLNSNQSLVTGNNNNIGAIQFRSSNVQLRCNYSDSTSQPQTHLFGPTIRANKWYYVQQVHDGTSSNNVKLYVNGVLETTISGMVSGTSSPVLYIGDNNSSGGTAPLYGHISDLKITTETSPATAIPSNPRSSDSNTKFLLKGTDASVIDKSQVNNIKMNGPTTGSTTKTFVGSEPTISFVSGSNTDRYLNFDPTVLEFMEILGDPSIPFTIEGIWGWQGSTASPIFEIFQDTDNFFYFGGGPGGTQSGIATDNNLHAIFKIGGVERFKLNGQTGGYNVVGSSFKHQAITRNASGLMQHYYNGQLSSNTITHSGSDTVGWTSPVGYVGRSDWMGIYGRYEGYIHQIRLTIGLARYTANFTPPTASLEG